MHFLKGTKLVKKDTGEEWYEKLGNNEWDWWVSLNSSYVVETVEVVKEWKPALSKYVDTEIKKYQRHPLS